MISELIEIAKQQPVLVGGVGTVLSSALLYSIRSIPLKIWDLTHGSMISTINVNSNNDYYRHIDHYVWVHRIPYLYRLYEPADKDEDGDMGEIFLNPGYGKGYGFWRGSFFTFIKTKEEKGYDLKKNLTINLYTRNVEKVRQFILEATLYQRGELRQRIYTSSSGYWSRAADKRIRPLTTVFVNNNGIQTLLDTVTHFKENEPLYLERGVPYKLCVLLYGPPGTGKTSVIHAVASHFQLDINYITGLGNLSRLLGGRSSRPCMVVIEDIDTMADLNRDDDDDDDDEPIAAPSLSSLNGILNGSTNRHRKKKELFISPLHDTLNSLDGFTTSHGTILFITTNHPERLDRALLRPGRVDLGLEIGPLDFETASKMFVAFYGEETRFMWDQLKTIYTPQIGSLLQQNFMQNTPTQAIEALTRLHAQALQPHAGMAPLPLQRHQTPVTTGDLN